MNRSFKRNALGQKRTFGLLASILGILSVIAGVYTATRTSADFKTAAGVEYRWQQLEGDWVVLNYFAKWCAPCLRELPELNQFATQVSENVKLFGVNYDPMPQAEVEAMIKEFDIQFEVIPNLEKNRLPISTPGYLPATFIISPNGEIAATLLGEQTASGLQQKLKSLQLQTL